MAEAYCERCGLPLAMCQHGWDSGAGWRVTGSGPEADFIREQLPRPGAPDRALWWEELFWTAVDGERRGGPGRAAEARWSGSCAACGDRWEPGDAIAYSEEDGGWLGPCCGTSLA